MRSQRAEWKWNEIISSNNLKLILVVVIFVMNVSRVMPMLDFDFVIGFICNTNLNVPWYLIVPWEMWLWFRISNYETQLGIDILNISVELSWSENHLIIYWYENSVSLNGLEPSSNSFLKQCWQRTVTRYGITRSQWVDSISHNVYTILNAETKPISIL